MGARALLEEMLDLVQAEIQAVLAGDHAGLAAGSTRHEELLAVLPDAEVDADPGQLRVLISRIDLEKAKLRSLLESESGRVDFMLRLILGGGKPAPGSYPVSHWQQRGPSQRLNRRT
jgi:hypothetical protein